MSGRTGSPTAGWRDPAWWRAVLLGGAVGDALGAPVEFLSTAEIRSRFGPRGLTGLVPHDGRLGAVTDDTQMTLFTAEALLAWSRRAASYGTASLEGALHGSYQRWLATQGEEPVPAGGRPVELRGLVWECADLHHRRAPGTTCLSALRSGGAGDRSAPRNSSKGCGGVMRAAPAAEWGFDVGVAVGAVTHGHPTGYLSAGALAEVLHLLGAGSSLGEALDAVHHRLAAEPGGDETAAALAAARRLAASAEPASPETVERLGGGWVAEEALAIGVLAALRADGDAMAGLLLAVNHSGDSDSTGAIAGHLLGALLGEAALPERSVAAVEAHDVIATIAGDLAAGSARFDEHADVDLDELAAHTERYPYC